MISRRLRYRPLEPADVGAFHALVTDPHVRRYPMDGQIQPRERAAERIRESAELFTRR